MSSSRGLEPITPQTRATIASHLLELVYTAGEHLIASVERVGAGERWRLVPRDDVTLSSKVLAATLRHPRLLKAEAGDGGIVVTLLAGEPPRPGEFFFDVGPFEQEEFTADKLVLTRRSGDGLQRIEVVRVDSQDEEWRRFLGRQVDLTADMSPGILTYVRDVPSVRVVPLAESPRVALHFRMTSPIFRDRGMRRMVAAGIRRGAIAQMATGDRSAALPVETAPDGGRATGQHLRLLFLPAVWDHQQAAIVLEQQLIEMGFEVTLSPMTIKEMDVVMDAGEFDALIFYGSFEASHADKYTTGNARNFWGYGNPDYDLAVAAGKFAVAEEILKEDVPYTPLYRVPEAVAVDRRFCGVHPRVDYDLSWLADVHPCAPGEAQ